MSWKSSAFVAAAAAVALFGLLPSPARAADPLGPPIGNLKYRSVIQSDTAVPDEDVYTQRLLRGEQLSVVVSGQPGADGKVFPPILDLIDPDGVARFADVVYSGDGRTAQLRKFAVDKSGTWAARVSGRGGAEGEYVIAFQLRPIKKIVLRRQKLGNDQPFFRTHVFPAFEGANFNSTITWDRRSLDVEMRALLDPSGADVPDAAGDPAVEGASKSKHRVSLTGVVLGTGDGDYSLRVRIPTASATYSISIDVDPGVRPVSRQIRTIGAVEPFLDPRDAPLAGDAGETVRITGGNFSTGVAPTVLFGRAASPSVTVGGGGTFADVVIPTKDSRDLALVPMYVVNPDGQSASRDAYFAFIPPPEITDLLDGTTRVPVRQSTTKAGRVLVLTGENFLANLVLRVGTTVVPSFTLVSQSEIRFTLPNVPQATVPVSLTDPFGRSDETDFAVFFKTPPAFDAATPYTPAAVGLATETEITVKGSGFAADDQFLFNGSPAGATFVDAATLRFTVPPLGEGFYSIRIVDSIGTVVDGPQIQVKAPPIVNSVTVVGAPLFSPSEVPLVGGSTVQVDGQSLGIADTVTLGGTVVTDFVQRTASRTQFIAPPGSPGFATLEIVDGAGQSATFGSAVRYEGYQDATAARLPAVSTTDDLSAFRGAVGDLDRDGSVDDLAITADVLTDPGSRTTLTRVFMGNAAGKLTDVTASQFPAGYNDSTGRDPWDGTAIALGDLDGVNGPDILVAGNGANYAYSNYYPQGRVFRNNGAGTFTFHENGSMPSRFTGPVYAYLYGYWGYLLYTSSSTPGVPQAVAIGDVDKDGDADVLLGNDTFDQRTVRYDPTSSYLDLTQNPPYISNYRFIYYYRVNYAQYQPAVRLYENKGSGSSWTDRSRDRLPAVGTSDFKRSGGPFPGLHCRDMALADLDVDGDLDLVVAWDDPTTVTPLGLSSKLLAGTSSDSSRTATRVLVNGSPTGSLRTDATATWMPNKNDGVEFWQANRIKLDDLDGDGDPELVLLHAKGLDDFTGTGTNSRTALRVLRNDRTRFVDVTPTAIPAIDSTVPDDWRGDALAIRDINGDGRKDIVVASTDSRLRVRIFAQTSALRFTVASAFFVNGLVDSGEAQDVHFVPDLGGAGAAPLLLLHDRLPQTSPSGAKTRIYDFAK